MATIRSESGLVDDLKEDIATRWIPDVIADSDLPWQVQRATIRPTDVAFVNVPRREGGVRRAPVLSGGALARLRVAVAPLRRISESVLGPTICGYRTGASGDTSYSGEYRRFREMSRGMADDVAYVVLGDVRQFFDSVDLARVREPMTRRFGDAWEPVEAILAEFAELGVQGLPAGYGDARLIANLLLSQADARLSVPFTRWVDDYRLFVDSMGAADCALAELRGGLSDLGLELNDSKVSVLSSREFTERRIGVPLDSVYHPQDEPPQEVRAALGDVFVRAVQTSDRRLLRFSLPRLAEQGDTLAVEYALGSLRRHDVDAPRLVAYLAAFLDLSEVRRAVLDIAATPDLDDWTLLRMTPLLCRIELEPEVVEVIVRRLTLTDSPMVWGTLLRVLSVHRYETAVLEALRSGKSSLDPRAAVAAYMDLGHEPPPNLVKLSPETATALSTMTKVPLPAVSSLL